MATEAATPPPPPAQAASGKGAPAAAPAEHKLESAWRLWYDKKLPRSESQKKTSYEDNLRKLEPFDTLEGFWRVYSHLKRPSSLPRDVNMYLFREGLTPMWECFPHGGCWILKVKKHVGVLSKMWQDLVFGAIGEMFEEPSVVGVTLATRAKEDMLSVWCNLEDGNEATRFHIGEHLKTILNFDKHTLIEYKTFKKAHSDKSTYSNTQGYVFAAAAGGGGGGGGGSGSGQRGGGSGGGGGQRGGGQQGGKRRNKGRKKKHNNNNTNNNSNSNSNSSGSGSGSGRQQQASGSGSGSKASS